MKKSLFVILAILAITTSCKKEGCTNEIATNYSEKAKKDDGSCKYEGQVIFWFNESTSQQLISAGVNSVNVKYNGTSVALIQSSNYSSFAPECGSTGTVKMDLGSEPNKTFNFKIEDNNTGTVIWDADAAMQGNTCLKFQLSL